MVITKILSFAKPLATGTGGWHWRNQQ